MTDENLELGYDYFSQILKEDKETIIKTWKIIYSSKEKLIENLKQSLSKELKELGNGETDKFDFKGANLLVIVLFFSI